MALIGLALAGAGLIGAARQKTPKIDMTGMNAALALIDKQERNLADYFKQAGANLETQYGRYYGTEMEGAVNTLANQGIYESPIAQKSIARKQAALAETYATAKSQLAGQQMQAQAGIDQARVGYLQNLASLHYQRQSAKMQGQSQLFGAIGGLGAALL